ncbi:replicative DNA helicase [Poriferisphaera sp. WC338]|uniref:replicative DNA helicase n=1 Tax=Poriferisphaera sp. WC338 TaxID=3425129 RepID=UPI003D8199DB
MEESNGNGKNWKRKDREERKVDLAGLFEKLPPHAVEAEAAVLGSMILDWRVCGEVVQILSGNKDFYKPAHGVIYDALVQLYDETQSIDMVQLNQRLVDKQMLEQVGGLDYLVQLAEAVPSATNASYYAKIVKDKATLRGLIESAGQILYDCYNSDQPVQDLLDKAERNIFEIAEDKSTEEASDLTSLLHETYTRLEMSEVSTGIQTGYYEVDEMTNGLQPGEMIIVAARPSMGKTAFALNVCENVAAGSRVPCAVFSLEMGKQQLAQRLLCSRSGVDSHRLRRNMLNQDDFAKLSMAVGDLSEAPLYIDDTPGLTLLGLRAKARRLYSRYGIKMIMIDYMQLMSAPGADSRQQEVSNISRGIKALARELSVPVICLSQLNRSSEGREGHRPRMSDLRESGSIEQDADVVAMLHREDYYHRGEEDYQDNNIAELIIAKQRNGPTGVVKLHFDGGTTRFNNLAFTPAGGEDGGGF